MKRLKEFFVRLPFAIRAIWLVIVALFEGNGFAVNVRIGKRTQSWVDSCTDAERAEFCKAIVSGGNFPIPIARHLIEYWKSN